MNTKQQVERDDLTTVYLAGFERGRDAEREAMAKWLREVAGDWPRRTAHARMIAAAIERGDHVREPKG